MTWLWIGDGEAIMFLNLPLLPGITALAFGAALAATHGAARQHETTMACSNPASGARWQIRIDTARRTVDLAPARISDTEISWHDAADGGDYTLDRNSGELTVVVASSTGGYFLHDRCAPKKPN
jgi:hypothetical protein